MSQKVRRPSTWPTQASPLSDPWSSTPLEPSIEGEELKHISFMSAYWVPSMANMLWFVRTSHSLMYLSVPTLMAVLPSLVILIEYMLPLWPLRLATFFPLSEFQTLSSWSSEIMNRKSYLNLQRGAWIHRQDWSKLSLQLLNDQAEEELVVLGCSIDLINRGI